jgi:hypothetical protein
MVERAEQALPIEEMVGAAVAATVTEDFRFPTAVLEYRVAHDNTERS